MFFSISYYASVSTQTSVLIIGGYHGNHPYWPGQSESSIFEYKDDQWTVIGNLKQSRLIHQAISIGSFVMIIGGQKLNGGIPDDYYDYYYYADAFFHDDEYDSNNET